MFILNVDLVVDIHDEVLNPGELTGLALDKSLEGALARVENRIAYGLIDDVFDLAAAYAVAIAQGHCFNDAKKRTAYRALQICLVANGVPARFTATEIGPVIIRAAQRLLDEGELADWLRKHS
jgi:death-on-curing protein